MAGPELGRARLACRRGIELLNSGIEAAIDRVGLQWHAMAKRAKDLGSAAVLLSLVLCLGIWIGAIWQRVST